MNSKIVNFESLKSISKGKRIIHCHGCFDLLHIGHIKHLQEAKSMGDLLIVTITPDKYVNKGPGRPAFPQIQRLEAIAALECVDYVVLNLWPTAVEAIQRINPIFFVKGSEFRDRSDEAIQKEEIAIKSIGGKIAFTSEEVSSSSSALINRHLLPEKLSAFLEEFRSKHSIANILQYFENAKQLKVLVVGEAIIDVYHYCQALGKSGKEPILAVKRNSTEQFAGGSLAVANHLASFCDNVDLLTSEGNHDGQGAFIRGKLSPNVQASFLSHDGPTITKHRYIEEYPFQKMFEVYEMEEEDTPSEFNTLLYQKIQDYDLVVVVDYGHGLLNERSRELLAFYSRYLALNSQANAANHGYNTVSKYSRSDYICISENELRLDVRHRKQSLNDIVDSVASKMNCKKLLVTRGRNGVLGWDINKKFTEVPSITSNFSDRVGAGDAVFAITSLLAIQKAPIEVIGLIGNTVGAQAIEIMGNRTSIDKGVLIMGVTSLLK